MTTSAADHDDPTKATITDVATLIATGAGAGLSPVAPGTAGSIVAAALLAFFLDMPVIWHWWVSRVPRFWSTAAPMVCTPTSRRPWPIVPLFSSD